MASISDDPNGRKRILFIGADGKRRPIRLGKVQARYAESFKVKVEDLVNAQIHGRAPSDETAKWLRDLDPKLVRRLERVGLVASTGNSGRHATLDELLAAIKKSIEVKSSTQLVHGHVHRNLRDYFGASTSLRTIGPQEADEWRQWLRDHEKLSPATVSKRVKLARQFFKLAVRWKMVAENPFADVKAGAQTNPARQFFISRDVAQRVLDACPDMQWRLIFALSRYGGLRCPSEHLLLTWQDIRWDDNRIKVTSPKTEHNAGGESRLIPLFPELRPLLLEAFESAEPGAVHVITRYRDATQNLRTQLERIIFRAGVIQWPKLFHNLRASRQTELEQSHPSHVVCAWLGNSPEVARKHYLTVQDSDFEKAAQNQAQSASATGRQASPTPGDTNEKRSAKPSVASPGGSWQHSDMALVGPALPSNIGDKSKIRKEAAHKQAHVASLADQLANLSDEERATLIRALQQPK